MQTLCSTFSEVGLEAGRAVGVDCCVDGCATLMGEAPRGARFEDAMCELTVCWCCGTDTSFMSGDAVLSSEYCDGDSSETIGCDWLTFAGVWHSVKGRISWNVTDRLFSVGTAALDAVSAGSASNCSRKA